MVIRSLTPSMLVVMNKKELLQFYNESKTMRDNGTIENIEVDEEDEELICEYLTNLYISLLSFNYDNFVCKRVPHTYKYSDIEEGGRNHEMSIDDERYIFGILGPHVCNPENSLFLNMSYSPNWNVLKKQIDDVEKDLIVKFKNAFPYISKKPTFFIMNIWACNCCT